MELEDTELSGSEGGSNTLSGLITLSADSELQADAGTNLTLDVSSGNALSGDFTLTVDAEGDVTIADAIATSSGGLTKTGSGNAYLVRNQHLHGSDGSQRRDPERE